ncbi:unnamed protein product [Diabrotica balteata]|uniref:Uncharacterized protein n=1 Tax=Diabrotica balteata TaxID=107213 RepID=A0A9N9T642_DIABA|nr:unnamed protein product [Diabrotica balteata]
MRLKARKRVMMKINRAGDAQPRFKVKIPEIKEEKKPKVKPKKEQECDGNFGFDAEQPLKEYEEANPTPSTSNIASTRNRVKLLECKGENIPEVKPKQEKEYEHTDPKPSTSCSGKQEEVEQSQVKICRLCLVFIEDNMMPLKKVIAMLQIVLPEVSGKREDIEKYRGICIQSAIPKLLDKLVTSHLSKLTNNIISHIISINIHISYGVVTIPY